jgi:hypothetical protein
MPLSQAGNQGLSENGIESDPIDVNFLMARGYDKPFEGRG